jgi:hypothetical protein
LEALLERSAVEQLACDARFRVSEGDAGLLCSEVGKQVLDAIVVGILDVGAVSKRRRAA